MSDCEKIKQALKRIVVDKKDLTRAESIGVFEEIMDGKVPESILAAFLTALRIKGETVEEAVGAAMAMRGRAVFINAGANTPVDTCGTGGDGLNTFNISTTSAFIASGAGACIAKHGNRAVTGKCGSGDVLAALGFNLDVHPAVMEHCLQEHKIAFLFAPRMHPAMRFAAPVRKSLGFRTVFNLLGPLVNPAGAHGQVVGVFDIGLTEFIGECLKNLGIRRAFVVHGYDGMDEISVLTPTRMTELREGKLKTFEFNARNYIDADIRASDLSGADANYNAQKTLDILNGKLGGAARGVCIINAAAAIIAAGISENFEDAVSLSEKSLDSGAAMHKLEMLIKFSNQNKSL